ncbi:hypothetical protein E2R51_08440 [Jeotgalibacillus sp. S-D1]|uniref:hypothetical protein n=1 Tax=Jeotgalibacillus sp. S-D1 TaxID=2552189 RepID=UPI001059BABD|nr:hypothetical protein E2R51_08440 [Jeotgalibacillus sp. S-D1]
MHEMAAECILKRVKKVQEGNVRKESIFYYIADKEKAKTYQKIVLHELMRSKNMMIKSIRDHER